jgi:hypothetical protein
MHRKGEAELSLNGFCISLSRSGIIIRLLHRQSEHSAPVAGVWRLWSHVRECSRCILNSN